MRSSLLGSRLSVISDQSATLQTSKVTGDARRGHTSGVDHPRARAYVHGSGGQGAITLTITAGEKCRTQTRSIESRTSPGKFISWELTILI